MHRIDDAWAAFTRDDYTDAERQFEDILTEAQDEELMRQAQFGLGYVFAFTHRFSAALSLFAQLYADAERRGALGEQHRALHQVGMVERMAGHWRQAKTTFEQEADLIKRMENPPLPVAVNAYEQGLVALHLNELERAHWWLERSLAHAVRTDDHVAVGCAHRGFGEYFHRIGERRQARHAWEQAVLAFAEANERKAVEDVQERLKHLAEPPETTGTTAYPCRSAEPDTLDA
ncbi:tetratricopeptide repeat protein [Deinococcus sonorensis]|uniref:Tol-pal system YbgF family protein n=1 Tax=Deinococcus sonorensis TaxID=309891 RepID=A0ABV8YAA0_9DEIO